MNAQAPGLLNLTPLELLTTTRSVRKRLDFERPLDPAVLRTCVAIALQAPSGSNRFPMQFVIVTDEGRRRALADAYRIAYEGYRESPGYIGAIDKGDPEANAQQQRTARSADYLAEHFHRSPAIVLACGLGRADDGPPDRKTNLLGSIAPGMWSFMLAARLHGLGTCWTGLSLREERRTADAVGIPIDEVTIAAVTPVAHTRGTDFRPALRPNPDDVIHWEVW